MKSIVKRLAKDVWRRVQYGRDVYMRFPPYPQQIDTFLHSPMCYDYVRYASFALAAARIRREGIIGAVAECGVWRGDLSVFLHQCFSDRDLYLFDTFEGFSGLNTEVRPDDSRFRDTSEDAVLSRLHNSPRCFIRKGFFPESATGLEQLQFSCVVLDFDIYEATFAALNFFYPLLSQGGYIFIHDYNSPEYDGACKRATDEFLVDKVEHICDMPDLWGTAFFRKV